MKVIKLTEGDLFRIIQKVILEQPEDVMDKRLGIEKTNMQALNLNPSNPSDVKKYRDQVYGEPPTGHEAATIFGIMASFIPIIGPFLASGIGYLEAVDYWQNGQKQDAVLVSVLSSLPLIGSVVMKIPGVKTLGQEGMKKLAEKLVKLKSSPTQTFDAVETKVVKDIVNNQEFIESEIKSNKSVIISDTEKKGFNLERKTEKAKVKKTPWNYDEVKISDNLILQKNPKGKLNVATVKSTLRDGEYVDLKKATDELGEYYYMSAKMSNPREAGVAFNELKKFIPSGSRFGEAANSLSTDSFYNILRRIRSYKNVFKPKVKNYIILSDSGVNRFQSFIKNTIQNDYRELRFKTVEDAQTLINEINKEIEKVGINSFAKVKDSGEGYYLVSIPNIELIVP